MQYNPNSRYAKFVNGGAKNEKDQRKKARMVVSETARFDSTIESHLTDMSEINNLVNDLLGSVFSDFAGSYVSFNQTGGIQIEAYFEDRKETNDGRIKSLQSAADLNKAKKENSAMAVINAVNALRSENTYVLNQETKDMLEELITVPNGNYNWKQLATECLDRTGYGQRVLVKVIGIDILKVLKKIYGAKNNDGANYAYQINPINAMPGNVLLYVARLNVKDVEALSRKYGMAPNTGSIRMVPYVSKQ